ncbi:MAG: hypothetical protein RR365_11685 [Bacteroides sp.]
MMDEERKQPFIKQQAKEDELFLRLQAQTLEEVQRMSGNVWTDFNIHDPGVTLADVANYALTELDYKFGFPLANYLTTEKETFRPERFGLLPPDEVYTTAPVTTDDYRRLLLANIPEIENVTVECGDERGGYNVRFTPSPFTEENGAHILKRIKEIYHSHRNLCERLNDVAIVQQEKLEFQAELEIEPGCDATTLLVRIYHTILRYLSGSAHVCTEEERLTSNLSPEEWLEGSEDGTRIVTASQQYTEYELYKKLRKLDGIRAFSICYLMKDGKPLSDFSEGYGLKIPEDKDELKVRIRCGRTEMTVDFERFKSLLRTSYFTQGRSNETNTLRKKYNWSKPKGTYRDIFTQTPMAKDFPLCYRLTESRERPTSFEAYLKLYDRVAQQGLDEVRDLPQAFSIEEEIERKPSASSLRRLKSLYLDFLDKLYGVESQPGWLSEFGNYGETPDETRQRRMAFLRRAAYLTKNRPMARNITDARFGDNVPAVKQWFCLMLGADESEDRTVGNVLPSYNLRLIEADDKEPWFLEADSALIDERMLDADKVELINTDKAEEDDDKRDDYTRLRQDLPIFNENKISGDLFRNGTRLDSYRIVNAGQGYYMLVFRNREREGWTNLGRSRDKGKLNTLAKVLRRFLWRLNRECETLYVFEPMLLDKSRPFELDLVLPTWTYRFHSPRFREMCDELLCSIIPAHLTYNIYWLNQSQMMAFEKCYRTLMMAMGNNDLHKYKEALYRTMCDLFKKVRQEERITKKG